MGPSAARGEERCRKRRKSGVNFGRAKMRGIVGFLGNSDRRPVGVWADLGGFVLGGDEDGMIWVGDRTMT